MVLGPVRGLVRAQNGKFDGARSGVDWCADWCARKMASLVVHGVVRGVVRGLVRAQNGQFDGARSGAWRGAWKQSGRRATSFLRPTAGYSGLHVVRQIARYPAVGRKKLVARPPDCLTLGFFLRPVPAVSRATSRLDAKN